MRRPTRNLTQLLAAAALIGLSAACGSSTSKPAAASSSTTRAPATTSTTATPTTVATPAQPVLGRVWGPGGQRGYGEIRPSSIFNGGDPTGIVDDVRWQSWGGDRANGSGLAYYAHATVADSTREPATVVAFNLGSCKGVRAYTAVEWFFPQHGQRFDQRNYIDICTGERVGKG